MTDRDIFAVNGVGGLSRSKAFGFDVETELVTKEVEINPRLGFAALGATENIGVEAPSLFFVLNRVSKVEYRSHV